MNGAARPAVRFGRYSSEIGLQIGRLTFQVSDAQVSVGGGIIWVHCQSLKGIL